MLPAAKVMVPWQEGQPNEEKGSGMSGPIQVSKVMLLFSNLVDAQVNILTEQLSIFTKIIEKICRISSSSQSDFLHLHCLGFCIIGKNRQDPNFNFKETL